jgi:hypothetical protein
MPPPVHKSAPAAKDSLSVELGSWFKAHATGRGVLVIPVVVAVLAVAELIRLIQP